MNAEWNSKRRKNFDTEQQTQMMDGKTIAEKLLINIQFIKEMYRICVQIISTRKPQSQQYQKTKMSSGTFVF